MRAARCPRFWILWIRFFPRSIFLSAGFPPKPSMSAMRLSSRLTSSSAEHSARPWILVSSLLPNAMRFSFLKPSRFWTRRSFLWSSTISCTSPRQASASLSPDPPAAAAAPPPPEATAAAAAPASGRRPPSGSLVWAAIGCILAAIQPDFLFRVQFSLIIWSVSVHDESNPCDSSSSVTGAPSRVRRPPSRRSTSGR